MPTRHRFALPVTAAALLAVGTLVQAQDAAADDSEPTAPVGVFADADGDGIANHADDDFVRPGRGRGRGPAEFVDADGDGVNDLAPDADGDGIANHLDDDYERPGAGRGRRGGRGGARQFVDEDGDGVNDLAPDADGDGIANHLDEDYERGATGNGKGRGRGEARGRRGAANGPGAFVDADGDGINDLAPDTDGDGVINHLDDDYAPPGDRGASAQSKRGAGQRGSRGGGRK